jgi:hypothetical protein
MRPRSSVLILLIISSVSGASLVQGQTLGDVARQEEERRKTIKEGGKVYTNKDLKEVPPQVPPAVQADTSKEQKSPSGGKGSGNDEGTEKNGKGKAVASLKDEAKEKEPTKDQAYWRSRMKTLQTGLERDQVYAEALQSRISALTTDFVNRDDPAQRSVIASERDKATAELERLKKAIVEDKKVITDLEEEARRVGVPPGWLR